MTILEQETLTRQIQQQLPQTQCKRCGFVDCEAYARAIATQQTTINRCQPGGREGIQRLAKLTKQPFLPLASDVGEESPRVLAVIDENWCIGCTKCLQACPVDAILGSTKKMHVVLEEHCTGCELCIPVCPTDCIQKISSSNIEPPPTACSAWSQEHANNALLRYQEHNARVKKRLKSKHKAKDEKKPITNSTEEEKRNFMAEIMRKALVQKKHVSKENLK